VADLAPIAGKLKPLIRLMSCEVVAAARALNRLLKVNGSDIHEIADSIGQANGKKLSEADAIEIYQRGVEDGRREAESARGDPSFYNVTVNDEPSWHEIACECARHEKRLRNDREREFVRNMVRRTVRGGEPTEKMARWLRDIYARVPQ
jgi:hypothetical protein